MRVDNMTKGLIIGTAMLVSVGTADYIGYNNTVNKYEKAISHLVDSNTRTTKENNKLKVTIKDLNKNIDSLNSKVNSITKSRDELENQLENMKLKQLKIHQMAEVRKSIVETTHVTLTAYTSFCNTGCTGITATGLDVRSTVLYKGARIVAVDPKVIPIGSKLKIYPEDRPPFIAYAEDTGGAIKGHHIDFLISINNKSVADQFGKQENVKVEILRQEN